MVSQPQNPEFRINPKNFHLCIYTDSNIFLQFFQYQEVKTCVSISLTLEKKRRLV